MTNSVTNRSQRGASTKISAGSEIDAWCTSCRLSLGHRVVAMVGGLAKRVQCLSCNKQHNYRAPRGEEKAPKKRATATATATATARAPSRARAPAYRQEWEQQVSRQADGAFVPYSTGTTFATGQLIRHSRFGRGYVKESLGAQKVNVLFEDGVKTLIHGRG